MKPSPPPPPPALFLLLLPPFSNFLDLASTSRRAVSLLMSPLLNLKGAVSGRNRPNVLFVTWWMIISRIPWKLESSRHQFLWLNSRCLTQFFERLFQILFSFSFLSGLFVKGFQEGKGWPEEKAILAKLSNFFFCTCPNNTSTWKEPCGLPLGSSQGPATCVKEQGTQTATKANFPTRCQPREQVCQSPTYNDAYLFIFSRVWKHLLYQLPVPPPTQIPSRKDICRHIACRAKITITRVPGDCHSQKASFALYWLISPNCWHKKSNGDLAKGLRAARRVSQPARDCVTYVNPVGGASKTQQASWTCVIRTFWFRPCHLIINLFLS